LSSLQSFISSSNQPVTNNAHGLHGSTNTTNAFILDVLSFNKFNIFGSTNFIDTSPNPSAFASTFATQGTPTFGEPIDKKKKKGKYQKGFQGRMG
jgi:hypothetical protein